MWLIQWKYKHLVRWYKSCDIDTQVCWNIDINYISGSGDSEIKSLKQAKQKSIWNRNLKVSLIKGCPIKNDTLTLSHNFRMNYTNPTFETGMYYHLNFEQNAENRVRFAWVVLKISGYGRLCNKPANRLISHIWEQNYSTMMNQMYREM